MRLIDADALNDTVEKFIAKFGEVFSEDLITGLRVCVYIAMQQPTQPEIIHCRDCKHYYFADNRIPQEQRYVCDIGDEEIWQPNDYCSYGERREESNESKERS